MAINKVAYEFDPFELAGVDAPKGRARDRALNEIAEFVKTETLSYVGEGRSPVQGGAWKRSLSPEYKARKKAEGGSSFANLELSGDLLDSVDVVQKRGNTLSLQVSGSEAAKADGHNNFSGNSELPPREFIPNASKGQTFRREIIQGIRQIAEEFNDE